MYSRRSLFLKALLRRSAEVSVCFAPNLRLVLRHQLDNNGCGLQMVIHPSTGDRVVTRIDHEGTFEDVCRRDVTYCRSLDGISTRPPLRL